MSTASEQDRLRALHRYEILDTPPEEPFDDITRLLSRICGTKFAVVSFVDQDRQWFKSALGLPFRETPRKLSFCSIAIEHSGVTVIPDARAEPRLASNPLVMEPPHLRFYACAPLITPDGFAIGTVAILDDAPRTLPAEQQQILTFMARQIMSLLELRRALREEERSSARLVRTQALLRRARDEAERANRAKDLFIATLSHELRSPLSAVLGWARILRNQRLEKEKLLHGLEVIERNARLQSDMINNLLDLHQIITGRIHLTRRPVVLTDALRALVEAHLPSAEEKKVTLDLNDGCGDRCVVSADSPRFEQILRNLVVNSVKFTPPGGMVLVKAAQDAEGVRVSVRDNGRGIHPAELPRIFDRFHQGRAGLADAGGLGLGLTIVKQLVELHGWSITAYSQGEGRGAEFIVTIPSRDVAWTSEDSSLRSEAPACP